MLCRSCLPRSARDAKIPSLFLLRAAGLLNLSQCLLRQLSNGYWYVQPYTYCWSPYLFVLCSQVTYYIRSLSPRWPSTYRFQASADGRWPGLEHRYVDCVLILVSCLCFVQTVSYILPGVRRTRISRMTSPSLQAMRGCSGKFITRTILLIYALIYH